MTTKTMGAFHRTAGSVLSYFLIDDLVVSRVPESPPSAASPEEVELLPAD
jgi:hypothetical protein